MIDIAVFQPLPQYAIPPFDLDRCSLALVALSPPPVLLLLRLDGAGDVLNVLLSFVVVKRPRTVTPDEEASLLRVARARAGSWLASHGGNHRLTQVGEICTAHVVVRVKIQELAVDSDVVADEMLGVRKAAVILQQRGLIAHHHSTVRLELSREIASLTIVEFRTLSLIIPIGSGSSQCMGKRP